MKFHGKNSCYRRRGNRAARLSRRNDKGYAKVVEKHFGKRLGCRVDVLYLIGTKTTRREIERRIFNSDIIYVGGGNTLKMLKIWRKRGVDRALEKAYKKGIVLSGVSAGSVCWFDYGISDSRRFANPDADFIRVTGLGFINALHCPHYDKEKDRKPQLKKMMKKYGGIAIAIDNCCAIEVIGNSYRIISSKDSANAYKVYWKEGKFSEDKVRKTKEFSPVKNLLRK